MARHHTLDLDDLVLKELKRKVELRSGIKLNNYSDCKKLQAILEEIGIIISAIILARCFGLTTSNHRPFISTLDLLSTFIGFKSFNELFQSIEDFKNYALSESTIKFNSGEFSFTALELAIKVEDWKTVRELIDAFDSKQSKELDFTWFLGEQVRKQTNKSELQKLLAESLNGRKYFYEWFVDEDDYNSYFSEALLRYYKPVINSIGHKLFFHSYLDSKQIYGGFKIEKHKSSIYLDALNMLNELHYQQISRLFEMRILNEYKEANRFNEIVKIIDELLPLLANRFWRDQNWMLMRSVKALLFTGHFQAMITLHKSFKRQLEIQFKNCEGRMLSSADLTLQLVIHKLNEFKDHITLPPTRLRHTIYNEENNRIILESATSIIYAPNNIKNSLIKNLNTFISKSEHRWVAELLSYQ